MCTTELARVAKLMPEFKKLGVKVIALSCNSVDSHRKWIEVCLRQIGLFTNSCHTGSINIKIFRSHCACEYYTNSIRTYYKYKEMICNIPGYKKLWRDNGQGLSIPYNRR